jgi:hypothetical protein
MHSARGKAIPASSHLPTNKSVVTKRKQTTWWQVPEVAAAEIRALMRDRQRLETAVEESREENEGLVIMVAVQHLRLMLANWRRPLYSKTLRSRMQEARAAEDAEQRTEGDISEGAGIDHALFHAPLGNTRSPRKQHMMLTSYERRSDLSPPSPPSSGQKHSAFSPNTDNGNTQPPSGASTMVSGATTAWGAASGTGHLAHTGGDDLGESNHSGHAYGDESQGHEGSHEDIRRMRALNEGRAKYKNASFDPSTHKFGTDGFHPRTPPGSDVSPRRSGQNSSGGQGVSIDLVPGARQITTPSPTRQSADDAGGPVELSELDMNNPEKLIDAYHKEPTAEWHVSVASPDALSKLLSPPQTAHTTLGHPGTSSVNERMETLGSGRRDGADARMSPNAHQTSSNFPAPHSVQKPPLSPSSATHLSPAVAARSPTSMLSDYARDAYVGMQQHQHLGAQDGLGVATRDMRGRSPVADTYQRPQGTPQTLHSQYGELLPRSVHDPRLTSGSSATQRQHSSPAYVTPQAGGASYLNEVVSSAGRSDLFGAAKNAENHVLSHDSRTSTPARPGTPGSAARSVSEYKAIAAKADAEIAALQSKALKRCEFVFALRKFVLVKNILLLIVRAMEATASLSALIISSSFGLMERHSKMP